MTHNLVEKRRFPRVDTSKADRCRIRVFGLRGKPLVGRVINLSVGGVAFIGNLPDIVKTVKRYSTRSEIRLPDGASISATTTLVRIKPKPEDDECVCVLAMSELTPQTAKHLEKLTLN